MKTNIIILVGAALAIWIMFQVPGPVIPEEPEHYLTPQEYAGLTPSEQSHYYRYDWMHVVFTCPYCRHPHRIDIPPRTSYFRHVHYGISPILDIHKQLTIMESETNKEMIFTCRNPRCKQVFGLYTLNVWWSSGRRLLPYGGVAGVTP